MYCGKLACSCMPGSMIPVEHMGEEVERSEAFLSQDRVYGRFTRLSL